MLPASAGLIRQEQTVRRKKITLAYTAYEWWLNYFNNNQPLCSVTVDHEGLPTGKEVKETCGEEIYQEWNNTETCTQIEQGQDSSNCEGVYLQLVGTSPATKEIELELPSAEIWISLEGCIPRPPQNLCETTPILHFQAVEPLPNEYIIQIQGVINGEAFTCPGNQCSIPLQPTSVKGQMVEFWAESSFGDRTPQGTARARVIPWGDFMAPEGEPVSGQQWYVDILSERLRGSTPSSCTDIWQVFPPVGGPPKWLSTPLTVEEIQSSESFYYLAGILIANGAVDASNCPDGGLYAYPIASACGVEAAQPEIIRWQNYFDSEILNAANQTGVPAQLMKNVFSRESQFWPGMYRNYREAGLGQLTENGADTVLVWNESFYQQFCPLVISQSACDLGFLALPADQQNMLRGALVHKVNSSCPDCPVGIDLSQAEFSVRIFAESIIANCEQVSRLIFNTTNQSPGQLSSFEDLWRFTLVNYNAGSGCLYNALVKAWQQQRKLDWNSVSSRLESGCEQSTSYVDDISNGVQIAPSSSNLVVTIPVQIVPTEGPTVTATATPENVLTPTMTATPAFVPTEPMEFTDTPGPSQPGVNTGEVTDPVAGILQPGIK